MVFANVAKGSLAGAVYFLYGTAIASEHIQLVGLLAGFTVAVVGTISWLDSRIDKKLKAAFVEHEAREELRLIRTVQKEIRNAKGRRRTDVDEEGMGSTDDLDGTGDG